jgi:hypothetical protein
MKLVAMCGARGTSDRGAAMSIERFKMLVAVGSVPVGLPGVAGVLS